MANQIAYGFLNLKDVFARRVNAVGVDVVAEAIRQSVAEHERQIAALISLFVTPTTKAKTRFKTPTAARLQPLDESGRARPIRLAGYYDVAAPIQMGGAAWGKNFVSAAKMTVEEANEYTMTLVSADMRWVRDRILAALYGNASWTWDDPDDDIGSLTIMPLANGDAQLYLVLNGADQPATDTHYLAQAAAIDDETNPFPTIYNELTEHPENAGEVISFIPTNLQATTEALTNFRESPDPNVRPGANDEILINALGVTVPGEVIGYCDKNWIVHWRSLPDNYIVSVMNGGSTPLMMREDEEQELRGFKQVATRDNHPFMESQYMRRAGFGAWNRVGATVTRISNVTYAVPTNYTPPIP